MSNLDRVRQRLQQQLPLIEHMGIDIVSWDGEVVRVRAPLAPNLNVHGTAFGGSLFSVGAMTGWSAVLLTFMDAGHSPHVWLADSRIDFILPVRGDLNAEARIGTEWRQQLLQEFESTGRVNVNLDVTLPEAQVCAVRMQAHYAVKSAAVKSAVKSTLN